MFVSEIKGKVKTMLRSCCMAASPMFSHKTDLDSAAARRTLEAFWPRPEATALEANQLTEIRCDVQIIVPAYNVGKYLKECMDSVLSQKTKYSYHVILVNDGSGDDTGRICDLYRDDPRVTVIHQENMGVSRARNIATRELFGRHIMFMDSDDILCPGAIDALVDCALAHDADIVEAGAYYLIDGNRTIMHRYEADTKVEDPYAQLHGHLWGKVYKREVLAPFSNPEKYWYEDSYLSVLVFPYASNIWHCSSMVYTYRINQEGIVKSSIGKPRVVETYWITELLLRERRQFGLPMDTPFFRFMLLQIRLNQLRLSDLPEEIQESAFRLTCDLVDQYFTPEVMETGEKNLVRSLREKDFGMFRMCCKFF